MKPKLKPSGTEHLKLKCDDPPSSLASNFNLRRYIAARNNYIRMFPIDTWWGGAG